MKLKPFALSVLFVSSTVFAADSFDNSTRELLIKKFKKVLINLPPKDGAREGVLLRLADLHSEKARQLSMKEIEQGCSNDCGAGFSDREAALRYYKQAMKTLSPNKTGRVLSQMGHLYELNGQQNEAKKLYSAVVKGAGSVLSKAEALFSLAEMSFKKRDFVTAKSRYENVLKAEAFPRKGYATYRLAWSNYNLGMHANGIELLTKMLKTPELLSRNAVSGVISVDLQFKAEVAKDLATFYSHMPNSGLKQAEMVYELSPQNEKMSNLRYFAFELERLGNKRSSLEAFRLLLSLQSNPIDRIESQVRISQMELELKNKDKSFEAYTMALDLWVDNGGCNDERCKELRSRLRKYVLDWNHQEKKQPSMKLYTAYEKYLTVFRDDFKMQMWAVEVARKNQLWDKAYSRIELAYQIPVVKRLEKKPTQEDLLLLLVEIAELSKDKNRHQTALSNYLQKTIVKSKYYSVKYQYAYLLYKNNDYAGALRIFKEIIQNPSTASKDLKNKSADLVLDIYAIQKDDKALEEWSAKFAHILPEKNGEFSRIQRTSVFNQLAKLGVAQASASWELLKKIDLRTSKKEEQIKFYKNKIILAKELKKWTELRQSAKVLLQIQGITTSDKEMALSQIAWVSEMQLDFSTAFETTRKMQLKVLKPSEKALKLAILADLSGKKAETYYGQFLKAKDAGPTEKLAIAMNLIESNSYKEKIIKRYEKYFNNHKNELSKVYLESFAKSPSKAYAKRIEKKKSLIGTQVHAYAWKYNFLNNYSKLNKKVSDHKISSKTQRRLVRSIKRRDQLLNKMELSVTKAIASKDWLAQLYSINALAVQEQRFYDDIIGLPVPAGLTPEEESQYLQLLSQQAAPHLTKANDLRAKVAEFIANKEAFESYAKDLKLVSSSLHAMIKLELGYLNGILNTPESKAQLTALLNIEPTKPSQLVALSDLEAARSKVRSNPLNTEYVSQLMEVEKNAGNMKMVSYLKNRLENENKGETNGSKK